MKYPKLEKELHYRGIKKSSLAKAVGFQTLAPLTKRLTGDAKLSIEEAFKIADYLGMTVDQLFREVQK